MNFGTGTVSRWSSNGWSTQAGNSNMEGDHLITTSRRVAACSLPWKGPSRMARKVGHRSSERGSECLDACRPLAVWCRHRLFYKKTPFPCPIARWGPPSGLHGLRSRFGCVWMHGCNCGARQSQDWRALVCIPSPHRSWQTIACLFHFYFYFSRFLHIFHFFIYFFFHVLSLVSTAMIFRVAALAPLPFQKESQLWLRSHAILSHSLGFGLESPNLLVSHLCGLRGGKHFTGVTLASTWSSNLGSCYTDDERDDGSDKIDAKRDDGGDRRLRERNRQAGKSCCVLRVVRDVSCVRSSAREVCLPYWEVFGIRVLLLLRAVAPGVSRRCPVHFSSFFIFHFSFAFLFISTFFTSFFIFSFFFFFSFFNFFSFLHLCSLFFIFHFSFLIIFSLFHFCSFPFFHFSFLIIFPLFHFCNFPFFIFHFWSFFPFFISAFSPFSFLQFPFFHFSFLIIFFPFSFLHFPLFHFCIFSLFFVLHFWSFFPFFIFPVSLFIFDRFSPFSFLHSCIFHFCTFPFLFFIFDHFSPFSIFVFDHFSHFHFWSFFFLFHFCTFPFLFFIFDHFSSFCIFAFSPFFIFRFCILPFFICHFWSLFPFSFSHLPFFSLFFFDHFSPFSFLHFLWDMTHHIPPPPASSQMLLFSSSVFRFSSPGPTVLHLTDETRDMWLKT